MSSIKRTKNEMVSAKKHVLSNWKKPFTCVYGDNYAYGFHSYKDMMEWLDTKKTDGTYDEPPPSKTPTLEERAKMHMQYRLGRSPTTGYVNELDQESDPMTRRLEYLRKATNEQENRSSKLRRSRSYGAFTAKAALEIESDLRLEAATTLDGFVDRRRTRSKLLTFEHDEHVRSLEGRRSRMSAKDREFDETVAATKSILTAGGATSPPATNYSYSAKDEYYGPTESPTSSAKYISETNATVRSISTDEASARVWESRCKQFQIEIEQMTARLVEAETKLKTEVMRLKKKYQIQITELEMSLDVANKNNLELQKTIKRQALQITDLQNHYDELQRQLQTTLDQYAVAQRRAQALQAELEEMRANIEAAMRAKRAAEVQYEEAHARVNELITINVNISAAKSKLEGELSALQADYDEVSKELKLSDERSNRFSSELKHTVEILHEEQERVVKIESIRKSLEIEVKNLQIRLEEVETNALVGGKRVISKLESRIRDVENECEEEKRRHAETIKILRKKERHVKEILITAEEDHKNISILTDQLEKLNQKINVYKRQLSEQEGMSQSNLHRVRRFQRELEAAEERAESAESNLTFIRHKHRSFVTGGQTPGGNTKQIYVVEEHRHENF